MSTQDSTTGFAADRRRLEVLEAAARKGNTEAQFHLGRVHAQGLFGCLKNISEATVWFSKAAEGGHPAARDELARLQASDRKPAAPDDSLIDASAAACPEPMTLLIQQLVRGERHLARAVELLQLRYQWKQPQADIVLRAFRSLAQLPHDRLLELRKEVIGSWEHHSHQSGYHALLKESWTYQFRARLDFHADSACHVEMQVSGGFEQDYTVDGTWFLVGPRQMLIIPDERGIQRREDNRYGKIVHWSPLSHAWSGTYISCGFTVESGLQLHFDQINYSYRAPPAKRPYEHVLAKVSLPLTQVDNSSAQNHTPSAAIMTFVQCGDEASAEDAVRRAVLADERIPREAQACFTDLQTARVRSYFAKKKLYLGIASDIASDMPKELAVCVIIPKFKELNEITLSDLMKETLAAEALEGLLQRGLLSDSHVGEIRRTYSLKSCADYVPEISKEQTSLKQLDDVVNDLRSGLTEAFSSMLGAPPSR